MEYMVACHLLVYMVGVKQHNLLRQNHIQLYGTASLLRYSCGLDALGIILFYNSHAFLKSF